jgi:cysteine-rich repeat protein
MCQYTTCGDGRRQHPNGKLLYEECDDGNKDNTDSCDVNNSCKFTYCGDKILQYPNGKSQYEQCDL